VGLIPPGTTPGTETGEYGVWKNGKNPRSYTLRFIAYSYDNNGAFSGSGVITATIQLDNDADEFTYSAKLNFYDAAGKLMFSGCGAATAKRFQ
jgi:hypothetical protein